MRSYWVGGTPSLAVEALKLGSFFRAGGSWIVGRSWLVGGSEVGGLKSALKLSATSAPEVVGGFNDGDVTRGIRRGTMSRGRGAVCALIGTSRFGQKTGPDFGKFLGEVGAAAEWGRAAEGRILDSGFQIWDLGF